MPKRHYIEIGSKCNAKFDLKNANFDDSDTLFVETNHVNCWGLLDVEGKLVYDWYSNNTNPGVIVLIFYSHFEKFGTHSAQFGWHLWP